MAIFCNLAVNKTGLRPVSTTVLELFMKPGFIKKVVSGIAKRKSIGLDGLQTTEKTAVKEKRKI